jgi:NADH/NAD ratio-sensing transcriptional regulator Rex
VSILDTTKINNVIVVGLRMTKNMALNQNNQKKEKIKINKIINIKEDFNYGI